MNRSGDDVGNGPMAKIKGRSQRIFYLIDQIK